MNFRSLFVLLSILLLFGLHSCKSTYMPYKVKPEMYSFKTIHDKEILIAKADSTYILECFGEHPEILKKILSDENSKDSLYFRNVVHRSVPFIKKLTEYANHRDALAIYMVCIKPDGKMALNRLLESNIDEGKLKMKDIQHLVFEYKYEENVNAKCLECAKLIFSITSNVGFNR